MTSYKLTYFNFRARGELARLLFAAADTSYEDSRIEDEFGDEWKQLKPTTPFGQLPILEFDGIKLCQSISIARFLARRFDLAGKTELDQARADMLVDCMMDTIQLLYTDAFFFCQDANKKDEMKRQYLEEKLPVYLKALEALLKQNNGGDGFFVGTEMTWADLAFIDMVSALVPYGGHTQLVNYPMLLAAQQRIEKLPKISAWISKRPVTEF